MADIPVQEAPEFPAEGAIIVADGIEERVVYDRSEQGDVLGWHKEVVNNG